MLEYLTIKARAQGAIAKGRFRVMTIETDDRIAGRDFESEEQARRYADDAVSESDDGTPVAIVLDDNFNIVYRGRPYYSQGH
jgi:hypothetical protein